MAVRVGFSGADGQGRAHQVVPPSRVQAHQGGHLVATGQEPGASFPPQLFQIDIVRSLRWFVELLRRQHA